MKRDRKRKKDATVAISKTDVGIKAAVKEAIDAIGGMSKFIRKGESVFIKPNLTGDRDPSTAAVTNPEVVKALIELVYEQAPGKVFLGDSPSWGFDAEKTYDVTGARKVAQETGCTLVNLDKSKTVECTIPGAMRLKKIRVAKPVLDCDKIINVPVMKTHMQTIISAGLKNMKGTLPKRWKTRLHHLEGMNGYSGLEAGVADLHKLISPALTVVDGTLAMEGRGPFDGDPVKMDIIIAGENEVLVDAVCATVMGFDPVAIPVIKLCAEVDGISPMDYVAVGVPIAKVKKRFKPCPTEIYTGKNLRVMPGVVCTGCLATLNTAIHRAEARNYLENLENLCIGVGKNPPIPSDTEQVLYIGQCAREGQLLQSANKLETVKGCPPTGWLILEGMQKFLKEGTPK
jgi:uncharacterized protein (DUF362 family)